MRLVLATTAIALFAGPALAHDPVTWNGSEFHVLLEGGETGGSIGLFTETVPGPAGPPMHVHDDADEALFLLKGEARVVAGGKEKTIKEGEVAFAPKGSEHTFRVTSENGGKFLIMLTPAGFEGFFEAVAAEDLKIPQDMERINEIATQFKQRLVGPPLAE